VLLLLQKKIVEFWHVADQVQSLVVLRKEGKECECVKWEPLAQSRLQWYASVKKVLNIWAAEKEETSRISENVSSTQDSFGNKLRAYVLRPDLYKLNYFFIIFPKLCSLSVIIYPFRNTLVLKIIFRIMMTYILAAVYRLFRVNSCLRHRNSRELPFSLPHSCYSCRPEPQNG